MCEVHLYLSKIDSILGPASNSYMQLTEIRRGVAGGESDGEGGGGGGGEGEGAGGHISKESSVTWAHAPAHASATFGGSRSAMHRTANKSSCLV